MLTLIWKQRSVFCEKHSPNGYNYITSTSWLVEHCGIWEKKDSINENTRNFDMKYFLLKIAASIKPGECQYQLSW